MFWVGWGGVVGWVFLLRVLVLRCGVSVMLRNVSQSCSGVCESREGLFALFSSKKKNCGWLADREGGCKLPHH